MGQEALARTLVSSWQSTEDGLDLLLARERYRRLHDLLASGRMKVRVVPRDDRQRLRARQGGRHRARRRAGLFLRRQRERLGHRLPPRLRNPLGRRRPGRRRTGCARSSSISGGKGVDLPDAVVKHVAAMANRDRVSLDRGGARGADGSVPIDAVLAERPIYKGGQILRSWQKRFVQTCVEDWRLHGKARYLLADDVGLGKTLSMAAAALVLSMLDDKPVLILAPATLIWQWQDELETSSACQRRSGRRRRNAGSMASAGR